MVLGRRAVLAATAGLGMALARPFLPALVAPPVRAAATGVIRGRVAFLRQEPGPPPRPSVGDLGMPEPPGTTDQHVAVVYLESAPRGAFEERPGPRVVLDQRQQTFVPHVLAIPVGTTVEFRNSDRTYHNVFSFSKAKSFDLGRYATGRSRAVRFDRPGIVRVFCEIHSHMNAFILVFAHRHFAVAGADGEFRMEGVPPGEYTVSVWHPVLAAPSSTVRVPEEGGEVRVDFGLS